MAEGRTTSRRSFSRLVLHALGCMWLLVQEPCLGVAFVFTCVGLACWGCALLQLQLQPWVPLLLSAVVCVQVRLLLLVEREGLLAVLPRLVASALHRPAFELLGSLINAAAVTACNLLQVAMLVCMELDEEQRKEILAGMDPKFRYRVFQQPFVLLLPWPLRRLLLGRGAASLSKQVSGPGSSAPGSVMTADASAPTAMLRSAMKPALWRQRKPELGAAGAESCSGKLAGAPPALQRKGTADSLLDLVRGVECIVRSSGAAEDTSVLERILTEKMMGRTVSAARSLATSAQAQAIETFKQGQAKVAEIGEGVRDVVSNPRAQATTVSAVGGAVALGTGGGATGLVSGGLIGAACGLVPAVFTFGLSIPIGAAIGSGMGAGIGTTFGGAAGFISGGALGYKAYGSHQCCQPLNSPRCMKGAI